MTKSIPAPLVTKGGLAFPDAARGQRLEDYTLTKHDMAVAIGVKTDRSVDNYVKRKLLGPPLKFGRGRSARVRWTPADKEALLTKLAALSQERRAA